MIATAARRTSRYLGEVAGLTVAVLLVLVVGDAVEPGFRLPVAVLIARCLAITFALLVFVDSAKLALGRAENPPHNPRANGLAWAIACLGILVGGSTFVARGVVFAPVSGVTSPSNLAVLAIWSCLAVATVVRAMARAQQPRLILRAVGLVFASLVAAVVLKGGPLT